MKLKFTLYQLLIITLMMAGAAFCAHGQNTVIRGEVSDSKTGKPLQLIEAAWVFQIYSNYCG